MNNKAIKAISIYKAATVLFLASLPIIYCLFNIFSASQLANFDYYHNIITIFDEQGHFNPRGLLVPGNEHILAGAKALYAINVWLFDGRNIPLALMGFILAAITAVILYRCSKSSLFNTDQRLAFILTLATLIFSTQAIHPFMWGMSGAIWFSCNLCVVISILATSRGYKFCGILAAIAATLCDGAGLATWPAILFVQLRRDGHIKNLWPILVAAALTVAGFIFNFVTPLQSPHTSFDLAAVAQISLSFISNVLTNELELSIWFGAFAAVVCLQLLWRSCFNADRTLTFWNGIIIYVLTVAAMVGASRAGFNTLENGLTSRYAPISALLWISLSVYWLRENHKWGISILCMILLASFVSGYRTVRTYRESVLDFNLSTIALQLDTPPLDSFVLPTIDDQGRARLINTYKALNHYPFEANDAEGCGMIGKAIDEKKIVNEERVTGWLDHLYDSPSPALKYFNGWAYAPSDKIECILAIDSNNIVSGAAIYGQSRPDVNLAIRVPKVAAGYKGVVKGTPAVVLVKLQNDERLYRLRKN